MNKFYSEKNIRMPRVKHLYRYVKKMSRFGAYMEVEEIEHDFYNVELFCEIVHTDRFGNTAILRKMK